MASRAAIELVAVLRDHLATGKPLSSENNKLIVSALSAAPRLGSLDQAFGWDNAPCEHSAREIGERLEREALFREFASLYPCMTADAQAKKIEAWLDRYLTSSWR